MAQMTSICDMVGQYMKKKEEDKQIAEDRAAKDRYWKILICYDDDDDEESSIPLKDIIISGLPSCVAITPATESNKVIKSSVENLVQTPSESEGIPDSVCDIPLCNNPTPLEAFKEHSEIVIDFNDDSTSSENDSPYGEDIQYVNGSPPNSELIILEVVENVTPEDGEIKDDVLHEKLSKINLLIAKIEALKDNPPLSPDFMIKSSSTSPNLFLEETNTFDNSLPESETFCFNLEEISSGSTTTRSDYSLSDYEAFYDHIEEKSSGSTTTHADFSQYNSFIFDLSINPFPPADRSDFYDEKFTDELAHIISPSVYDCFYFKNEPELGDFTMDVVGDIFLTREPRVHVPNVLPTHPTLNLDLDFILFSDSLESDLTRFFPPGTRNKIFDPGIFIGVQSMNDEIYFEPDTGVLTTKVVGDIFECYVLMPRLLPTQTTLASNEEKSPYLLSHRGINPSKIMFDFSESPMMISGGNIPLLDVLISQIVMTLVLVVVVLRSLELHVLSFILGNPIS
ncbi:hypothetical protein Tco_0449045 [Tanacetum coccineum]